MNPRIRAGGGRIRLDPAIRSRYLLRQTLGGLFGQYRGYGQSKVALAAKRPGAPRLRHLVRPAVRTAVVVAGIRSIVAWASALPRVGVAYLGAAMAGLLRRELPLRSQLALVAAVATTRLR